LRFWTQTFAAVLRTASASGQTIGATSVVVSLAVGPIVLLGRSAPIAVTPVATTSLDLSGGGGGGGKP
jgi:hypothetical protein